MINRALIPPNTFIVAASQVASGDVAQFLYSALSAQFKGGFEIVNESTLDRVVPYANGTRKIRSIGLKANGQNHSLHFDITEVSSTNMASQNWLGR
jgi:hypothetical protein